MRVAEVNRNTTGAGPSTGAAFVEMETLPGFTSPPALWLRRAEPGYANASDAPKGLAW
jgi:hypothetical protein